MSGQKLDQYIRIPSYSNPNVSFTENLTNPAERQMPTFSPLRKYPKSLSVSTVPQFNVQTRYLPTKEQIKGANALARGQQLMPINNPKVEWPEDNPAFAEIYKNPPPILPSYDKYGKNLTWFKGGKKRRRISRRNKRRNYRRRHSKTRRR